MAVTSRRDFLLTAAAVPFGCAAFGTSEEPAGTTGTVRPPEVGQSWRYAKHDFFTGAMVDTQVDRVSAVGHTVEIESHSEENPEEPVRYPSWGSKWLHPPTNGEPARRRLPNEIQEPWGLVRVDPHWTDLQAYEKPIPLWPTELRPGWSTTVGTYYKIPDSDETMPWQLTMSAHRWERVTVPAGRFTALRYVNLIDFRYTNVSGRIAGQRKETIWFAPDIGRWVVRESSGTFRQDVTEEFAESSYRWELLHWA